MNDTTITLVFSVGGGLFCVLAAALDWDWFMNHPKARFFVNTFGRNGARVFYVLLGCLLIGLGGMMWQGQRGETESGLQVYRP